LSDTVAQRKVLMVDDDPKVTAFVGTHLRGQGYTFESALNVQEGLDKAANRPPDLVLLDLAMPVMDGLEALSRLREWFEGPIVILSATDEERQKVNALDLGADDYLTKPFGVDELMARVRAALRRADRSGQSSAGEGTVVVFGDVRVDVRRRVVSRAGDEVSLTRTEYELLHQFTTNPGKVMTHRELLRQVWGPEYGEETEYLRTFIKQLRRKLEPDPSRPIYILTQPGMGYRLMAHSDSP
jgi:two-component system KDP operon response regulator KdpE